jgi:two-component system, cell cycle response regulator
MHRLRRFVVAPLLLASLAGLLAFAVHKLVDDDGRVSAFFDNELYYGLLFAAVALCGLRAVASADHRAAWVLLAAGATCWTAGDVYWLVALSDMEEPPFPSLSDAGYLAYFPLVYAGLFVLLRGRLRASHAVWLDGLTAALAVGTLVTAVLLQAVLDSTGGSRAAVVTNLAYPAGDVILLALLVGALVIGRTGIGRAPLLLGAALAIGAVADGIYLFQVAEGTYAEGTFLDALWPASMLCLASAAWSDERRSAQPALPARPLLFVPLACGTAAVATVVAATHYDVGPVAVALAAATMSAVLVRLFVTLRENRVLLELTRNEAVTDPLTGLANRRKLLLDLDHACASLADGRTWLIALFDLDGFKLYNDSFGHPAGDALLVRLGAKLEQAAGPESAAYRLGGDEFCVLTAGTISEAATVLDRAAGALAERGEGFAISSSFGAVFLPEDAHDPSEALRLADVRLYAQKRSRHSRRDRPHDALVQALYEREPALAQHSRAVVDLSLAVGRRLGLDSDELEQLERAAQLHDIGKLAVPDDILRKPGPLTAEEEAFIRQHTIVGERILSAAPVLQRIASLVRSTHEHWDGTGYPDQLAGEAIPLSARIVAACDAYTAMRETRTYHDATPESEAVRELRRCAGHQFDPLVVEGLAAVIRERESAAA